eukprot:jgi/Psemu1/223582/e_gw1.1350.3.1
MPPANSNKPPLALGALLRSTELTTVDGKRVKLGDYWSDEDDATPKSSSHSPSQYSIGGPIFVSIGRPEQLRTFLDENPRIPRDRILVDDHLHKSYKETMGFSRFDESLDGIALLRSGTKLVLPLVTELGITKLWSYLTKIPSLAPVAPGKQLVWTDLPEGGLRNGGTLDRILYRWNDQLPGDVPDPSEVYREALEALERERRPA